VRKLRAGDRTGGALLWSLPVGLTVALVLALGASSAAGGFRPDPTFPLARGHLTKVIVLLREKGHLAQTLRSHGARHVASGTRLPFVLASVSSAQRRVLASDAAVQVVVPDTVIPAPVAPTPADAAPIPLLARKKGSARASAPGPCGTAKAPENDPEALAAIKATQATALGYDGRGVKVAYIAGPIDTTIPDFRRKAKYASKHSPAGSPVVTNVNFGGDPAGTPSGDDAGEAFLDASSIVAQGKTTFDLNDFVNTAHPLRAPCDIRITGAAPGARVLGLDVFSSNNVTTESNFIQAIDYAVAHKVKVLNESFGANNFPDTALDATRIVDDAAVAAGVTVVVSSGDDGITSTIGSPATDPTLIDVGASTTFRAYQQNTDGGINATLPKATHGTWLNNNISSISSAGFAQSGGNTVDLVAPGDSNWALCSANIAVYTGCTNENGAPTGIQISGGTSESAPLVAAAAAAVIQAYASTHHGTTPSPALVKQILTSTATDIDAPAEQQGAGLLNVLAAVKEATAIHKKGGGRGSLLVSPNQINITQNPGRTASRRVKITNTGSRVVTVKLSTRTLTRKVASHHGSFCLNPTPAPILLCGPPTAHAFQIWSGVTEVYQEQAFTVPRTGNPSRLDFSADYPFTDQTSVLHVALYDPKGAYAGYSVPQGIADYANVQVSNPRPGTWTAVFFTQQGTGNTGTSGTIDWRADTWTYGSAGSIKPSSLKIAPGATSAATFRAKSPKLPGDAAQSIVLGSKSGRNTVPVTVRTVVPMRANGGTFKGVLTGGNGRNNPAQTNTYVFDVPKGKRDLDVSASFADINDGVVAYLEDPAGDVVASSSNVTFDSSGTNVIGTRSVTVYKDAPRAGRWMLLLDWVQPVSGAELSEPFSGAVRFNQVKASADLPKASTGLIQGQPATFGVRVTNTAKTPEAFFLDPRTSTTAVIPLVDQSGSDQNMVLPIPLSGTFPLYLVPADTSRVLTTITGTAPVTYDIEPLAGDPNLSPAVRAPGVSKSQSGNSARLDYAPSGGEVEPGVWYLNPSQIGPYPATGAPAVTASATFSAVTKAFDPTVVGSTGDLWSSVNGGSPTFSPVYLLPGQTALIPLTITPTASPGTQVSGVVNLDDVFQADIATGFADAGGDELASFPYSYTVGG